MKSLKVYRQWVFVVFVFKLDTTELVVCFYKLGVTTKKLKLHIEQLTDKIKHAVLYYVA